MERSEDSCISCGKIKIFTSCEDCGLQLCQECAVFELLAKGCGTVVPVYFCPKCAIDPLINPNAAFRQDAEQ
jgi:hypothetical protein